MADNVIIAGESPPTASCSSDASDGCGTLSLKHVVGSTPIMRDETSPSKFSKAQRARIERNRQRALLLKESRLANRPYPLQNPSKEIVKAAPKVVDSGGGFLVEEDELAKNSDADKVLFDEGAILDGEFNICDECCKDFNDSFLQSKFAVSVCDGCRDKDEKHKLITKTDAKNVYLLKDVDFDRREPPLKFIVRKNPHNPRWGDMKLFLEMQVAERALEVWGTEEALEEAQETRADNREKAKQKKYDKKVKELRMAVRSSLWRKETAAHEHTYGEETYDEESDEYSKTCTECDHVLTYEKM